jgi:hypothetical protein
LWGCRAGLSAARLIAQRDEQRRNVLAVPSVARRVGRTRAARREAARRELQRHLVRIRVGATDMPARARILDDDVFDRVPAHVIVTAKVRARTE